jgi:hypothetical protein
MSCRINIEVGELSERARVETRHGQMNIYTNCAALKWTEIDAIIVWRSTVHLLLSMKSNLI